MQHRTKWFWWRSYVYYSFILHRLDQNNLAGEGRDQAHQNLKRKIQSKLTRFTGLPEKKKTEGTVPVCGYNVYQAKEDNPSWNEKGKEKEKHTIAVEAVVLIDHQPSERTWNFRGCVFLPERHACLRNRWEESKSFRGFVFLCLPLLDTFSYVSITAWPYGNRAPHKS